MEGLKRSLRKLEDLALEIKSLTTDRHIQIRKFIREERPHIKQWFDCWHIAKSKQSVSILAHFFILPLFNPSPSVRVLCFLSPFQPLAIHFITSHIKLSANIMCIYSLPFGLSLSCQSINMVSNLVISPPQCPSVHTTQCHNPHMRYDNYHPSKSSNVVLLNDFRCGERAVTEGQEKGPGTDPLVGSLDHAVLEEVVTRKQLLKDVAMISPAEQTSALEAFHRLIMYFAPKNTHYFFPVMNAR